MWPFKKQPSRTVMLLMHDGGICIREVFHTQSGWISRWIDNDKSWSILNPDGTTTGTSLVKRWYKHSGWPEDETEKEASDQNQ